MTVLGFILILIGLVLIIGVVFNSWQNAWQAIQQ